MAKLNAIAVVGATACGKSDLALKLAKRLGGELVCMDSMQIYRRMDIGTAKPTADERAQAPHHMLDIVEPTDAYTVAQYAQDARDVIKDIAERGRLPILVGGTGLYLRALMHGLPLGGAGGDEALRARLHALAQEPDGKGRLHARLAEVDPASAARLHPNDLRRVIRALEVYELTGKPLSEQSAATGGSDISVLPLGLLMPREMLYERIAHRVRDMMKLGLLKEVSALLDSGVPLGAQSMQGIGYKELAPVVLEGAPLEEAVWQITLNTRHYSKRQGAFFRTEPLVNWLDATDARLLELAAEKAQRYMSDKDAPHISEGNEAQ